MSTDTKKAFDKMLENAKPSRYRTETENESPPQENESTKTLEDDSMNEIRLILDDWRGNMDYSKNNINDISAYWDALYRSIRNLSDLRLLRDEILRYITSHGYEIYPEESILLECTLLYFAAYSKINGDIASSIIAMLRLMEVSADGHSFFNHISEDCAAEAEKHIETDPKTGESQYRLSEFAALYFVLACDIRSMPEDVRNTAADSLCNALVDFRDYLFEAGKALAFLSEPDVDMESDDDSARFSECSGKTHHIAPEQRDYLKSPSAIKAELDKTVIGQDAVKRMVSVNLFKHVWAHKNHRNDTGNNIMLIGPTGSGKSLIARKICELSGLPYVFIDASQLTEAGWHGADLGSALRPLFSYPASQAEYGIVVFDEFDKLAKQAHTAHGDDVGASRQAMFLSLLEGVPVLDQNGFSIPTKNLMFIFTGAFTGLFKARESRTKSIGFADTSQHEAQPVNEVSSAFRLTQELLSNNLLPELVGRMSSVVEIEVLNEAQMVEAVMQSPESTIQRNRVLLKDIGLKFVVDQPYVTSVVRKMRELGLGVRGANNFIDDKIKELLYEAYDSPDRTVFLSDKPKDAISLKRSVKPKAKRPAHPARPHNPKPVHLKTHEKAHDAN